MKSAGVLVLTVTLVAVACGKSGTSADGPGGAAGSGGAGTTDRGGSGGAAGSAAGNGGAVAGDNGASGAAGAAGGVAGTGHDAGTTTKDGGADAALACTTGETRCDDSGRRLRCASDGSWADDSYVCTVALSGSSDYNTMCALKADGRLACWASGDSANSQAAMMVTRAPADTWKQISVSDGAYALCGVGASGTISCWDTNGPSIFPPPAGTFETVSSSGYGSCALTDAGTPVCAGELLLPRDFVGPFKQLVIADDFVYGIDQNDALHLPDFFSDAYPAGKYKQVIANNNASCALRDDGAIFCSPVADPQPAPAGYYLLPPPTGNGFLEVAAIYGNYSACAIQADHTVTCWLGESDMQPLAATPSGTFTHIAGCEAAMCGIRTDGTTVCWEVPGYFDPLVPPAGW